MFDWRKLMRFSDVNFQTGLRFEMIVTLVTLKSCIPPKGGWAGLLLGCQGFLAPGIQGEGEGRPNVE